MTIILAVIILIALGLVWIFYKSTSSFKRPNLSYNERVFLEANLEIELNNKEDLTNRYNRANVREKKKDYKGAIEDINVILQHEKGNFELIFKRGFDKFKTSDFKGALSDFSEVIKNNPANKYAFYYRGLSNLKLSNFELAYNDLSNAVSLGVNDTEIFISRGIAAIEINKLSLIHISEPTRPY